MADNSNINKKLAIAGVALIAAYFIFSRFKKVNLKAATDNAPANFPPKLKTLFDELKAKGYSPKASPSNSKNALVMFNIETGTGNPLQIDVDEKYVVSIAYSQNSPSWKATYEDGAFIYNNKIVAESTDFLSGLLQIIANKDYIL